MSATKNDEIRTAVRSRYGNIATNEEASCCGGGSSCGDASVTATSAQALGYSEADTRGIPEGADMGLGCGNPQAIAQIKPGETVLDLGSGGGFDCFLAARQTGATGRVIGVDMTPEMVSKARINAEKASMPFVEFRLGEIEHLPVADNTVDVIISNCVINLSPDKTQVFRDAFRVLKRGGRLAISDIVATAPLPEEAQADLALYTGCMAGATFVPQLEQMMRDAGFADIRIEPKDKSRQFIRDWAPGRQIEEYVLSATIEARKP